MSNIEVRGLGLDYGSNTVLHDISFDVGEGEFVTLLGPSGCGKTTTLMSIAGLSEPDRGSIVSGGTRLFDASKKMSLAPERRNCGVVFQSYAIWPHMSVAQNVGYPLRLRRTSKAETQERVADALKLVGLDAYAERYPHELSGGQQQRVALARAVVYSPQVLLLDEPLSNLDAKLREQARMWLKEIQSRLGLTTIFVTHDQDEALALSDRVVVMNQGRIEQIGVPEQIYRNPSSPFVASFLGSSNLIPAFVIDRGSSTVLRLGEGGATFRLDGIEPPSFDQVQLMIRPEDITVTEDEAQSAGVAVRILSRTFLGARYRYTVEHAGATFVVDSRRSLSSANAIVSLNPDAVRFFPRVDNP